jgi:hypothetical protein
MVGIKDWVQGREGEVAATPIASSAVRSPVYYEKLDGEDGSYPIRNKVGNIVKSNGLRQPPSFGT